MDAYLEFFFFLFTLAPSNLKSWVSTKFLDSYYF